jgi:hypothetical protein
MSTSKDEESTLFAQQQQPMAKETMNNNLA